MSKAEENRKIIQDFYAAFFKGDADAAFKLCDPNLTITEVASLPYPGTFRGREQCLNLFGQLQSTWNDLTLDIADIVASDTTVAVIGTFRANAAKTGKPVEFPMVEVWKLNNGKIMSCTPVYGDTHLVVTAMAGGRTTAAA